MGITAKIVSLGPIYTETYTCITTFKDNPKNSQRRVAQYQESAPGNILVHKTVNFFLMKWVSGDPKNHDWEMTDAGWYDYDQAIHKLAFPGEKQALKKAYDKIQQ